jgi:metabolite-proton symporter
MPTKILTPQAGAAPSTARIMVASLIGTAIEFYDFYIYGTAAALVLGQLFFPQGAMGTQSLAAFATFGIAFLARPIGSLIFGHFGDRLGRKSTLVGSLLLMGLSTTLIGVLPGYASAGVVAPVLLCILRLGQGVGLGGEWGGAALLATENAPSTRRAWFGMFPQLGPSLGFLMSNGLFLLLFQLLTNEQFVAWGWRIPFLVSAVLVAVGLYVRRRITETPAFVELAARGGQVRVPLGVLFRHHSLHLALGSLAMVVCYAIFYTSTVFALDYGTRVSAIPRGTFLGLLCIAITAMAITTPISAFLSDRFGCRPVLLVGSALAAVSGFTMQPLLGTGNTADALVFLCLELGLMGLLFAPMGALLPSLFPPQVRYTGASASYNLGGILGASFAPYAAQLLLGHGGLSAVGLYISGAAVMSFLALLCMGLVSAEPPEDTLEPADLELGSPLRTPVCPS